MVPLVIPLVSQCSSHISTCNQPQAVANDLAPEAEHLRCLSTADIGLPGNRTEASLWSSPYPPTLVVEEY